MASDTRQTARAFVHSLNILLKFARLYEFGHVRTMAQFETAWKELRTALDQGGDAGLLLGASGNQIVLDGVPLGAAAAEKSFAQLLILSGNRQHSLFTKHHAKQFCAIRARVPEREREAELSGRAIEGALAGETSIKINEIRYVAEDGSVAGIKVAAQLTAKMLGGAGRQISRHFRRSAKDAAVDPGGGEQPLWRRRWRWRERAGIRAGTRRTGKWNRRAGRRHGHQLERRYG